MARRLSHRAWTTLTAAATLLPASTLALALGDGDASSPPAIVLAAAEGGEGGESGEGGEAGVDLSHVTSDPITYLTALDIIAAHYHAGLAAYRAGEHHEAGEMFAHPIAEVYVDLAEKRKDIGFADFGPQMEKASELALANADTTAVEEAAKRVFDALGDAEQKAPASSGVTPESARAEVFADMLDRAALQYNVALKSADSEPYLDGFGFLAAAKARAETVIAELSARKPDAAEAARRALDAITKAYPTIERPKDAAVPAGELLAAASRPRIAPQGISTQGAPFPAVSARLACLPRKSARRRR